MILLGDGFADNFNTVLGRLAESFLGEQSLFAATFCRFDC